MRKARELLTFHVAGMAADGDELPMVRTLAQLRADRAFRADAKDATIAMVQFEMPGKSMRLNITMDEHLLQAIDRAAESAGQSRSAFLAAAARARMLPD